MSEPSPSFQGSGWIEVIVGSMYSGKTEELIRRLRRAQIARQRVEIFKPAIDKRYDEQKVDQFLGLAAEHAAANDFNPAHSALSHGLVTLVNSAITVKPTREKNLNHARFLHPFGRVEKHRQTATLGYNETQASASRCRRVWLTRSRYASE